jgi:hypothetical protein
MQHGRLRGPIVALFLAAASVAAAAKTSAAPPAPSTKAPPNPSLPLLTPEALDQSLELGRQYLLNIQRPDGSFVYELDAARGVDLNTRHAVREISALWMLARFHRDRPSPETSVAILRSLKLQNVYAKRAAGGGRYLSEPGATEWTTNVVALYALTLLDYLAADQKLDHAARATYERNLADTAKFLMSLRMPTGRFYPLYRVADGRGTGPPVPYSDGEALYMLVRYAKTYNDAAVREAVLESAAVMYGEYVKAALRADPHSPEAAAFYQWGTMAFYELYTSGWPDTKPYAARAIAMARWMTDVNKVATQPGNMGPAFEGLAVAWELARLTGDAKNQKIIAAALNQGLAKLLTWQIGNPNATSSGAVPATFLRSPKSRGGVVTVENDPRIRTDTVMHQLHAELLVRQFMFASRNPATTRPVAPPTTREAAVPPSPR